MKRKDSGIMAGRIQIGAGGGEPCQGAALSVHGAFFPASPNASNGESAFLSKATVEKIFAISLKADSS
jgi:hypothetical protein